MRRVDPAGSITTISETGSNVHEQADIEFAEMGRWLDGVVRNARKWKTGLARNRSAAPPPLAAHSALRESRSTPCVASSAGAGRVAGAYASQPNCGSPGEGHSVPAERGGRSAAEAALRASARRRTPDEQCSVGLPGPARSRATASLRRSPGTGRHRPSGAGPPCQGPQPDRSAGHAHRGHSAETKPGDRLSYQTRCPCGGRARLRSTQARGAASIPCRWPLRLPLRHGPPAADAPASRGCRTRG